MLRYACLFGVKLSRQLAGGAKGEALLLGWEGEASNQKIFNIVAT